MLIDPIKIHLWVYLIGWLLLDCEVSGVTSVCCIYILKSEERILVRGHKWSIHWNSDAIFPKNLLLQERNRQGRDHCTFRLQILNF